ncbi:MAG: hypothetical protein JSU70_05105 [Phycisphaerales bacterium]|nr:MAG: hypothetical protein JSU70_05105 [Phycisphaerales bacterium]
MSSAEKIKRLFAKSDVTVSPKVDDRIMSDAELALGRSSKTESVSAEPNIWRIAMKSRITKIAVAAVIAIAVLLGVHYFGVSPDGAGVAWADVLENMEAAQTVTFTFESENEYQEGEYSWEKGTIMVKEPYRRIDRTVRLRSGDGPTHEEIHICIVDLSRQNRFVELHPSQKLAYYAPDHGGNDTLMTYDGLKKDFRDGTEESLGTVQIDGRQAVCFKISRENKEFTVWADPDTALPIRIERTAKEGLDKTILTNITFDVELDDELFDMTPPDDYCVMNMATEEFKVPFELTEAHLVQELTTSAKSLGGTFPTRFGRGRPGEDAVEKAMAEMRRAVPVEGGGTPMLGTEFLKRLPEGSDWQYVGEDVKLGDATKAVCWWKLPGSKTYRVVYGDLSVRDVEPNDLPPVPWLTEEE